MGNNNITYKRSNPYQKKQKSPIKHKYTKEEYEETKANVFKAVHQVDERLSSKFNPVKQRIIQMAVTNIEKAVKLYFNPNTYRVSTRQAKLFLKSTKELENIARFLPATPEKENIISWVEDQMSLVRTQFAEQYSYLKEIEKQLHELKQKSQQAQNIW